MEQNYKAFFPDLQHFYKHAEPAMTSYESIQLAGATDERVSAAISDWLDSLKPLHRQSA